MPVNLPLLLERSLKFRILFKSPTPLPGLFYAQRWIKLKVLLLTHLDRRLDPSFPMRLPTFLAFLMQKDLFRHPSSPKLHLTELSDATTADSHLETTQDLIATFSPQSTQDTLVAKAEVDERGTSVVLWCTDVLRGTFASTATRRFSFLILSRCCCSSLLISFFSSLYIYLFSDAKYMANDSEKCGMKGITESRTTADSIDSSEPLSDPYVAVEIRRSAHVASARSKSAWATSPGLALLKAPPGMKLSAGYKCQVLPPVLEDSEKISRQSGRRTDPSENAGGSRDTAPTQASSKVGTAAITGRKRSATSDAPGSFDRG
jgi:hypothetical protein